MDNNLKEVPNCTYILYGKIHFVSIRGLLFFAEVWTIIVRRSFLRIAYLWYNLFLRAAKKDGTSFNNCFFPMGADLLTVPGVFYILINIFIPGHSGGGDGA